MRFTAERQAKLIEAVASMIVAHAEELSELDRKIGDGDHGANMKRGFQAVLADLPALGQQSLPQALKGIGQKLVMTVGGASGPLYGTLFMALGKSLPPDPGPADLAAAFRDAVAAVAARGKSQAGQKTMLDVLVPVQDQLAKTAGAGGLDALSECARRAAEATIPMRATRGRASFLGDRSIGHMDPGARSSSLIIEAVCGELRGA